jgi:hypothetical protein
MPPRALPEGRSPPQGGRTRGLARRFRRANCIATLPALRQKLINFGDHRARLLNSADRLLALARECRKRAEEILARAETLSDANAREGMQRIAANSCSARSPHTLATDS